MQVEQKITTSKAVDISEYDSIAKTIQHYIDGGRTVSPTCSYFSKSMDNGKS